MSDLEKLAIRRHNCGFQDKGAHLGWMTCTVCDGRIHLEGCTSRKNPAKDCCEARHKKLHDNGQTVGIVDKSVPMIPFKV